MNLNIAITMNWSTDSFEKIIDSAKYLHSSEESFNTSLRNVLDLFSRTGNVLKATFLRFTQSVKRGEMEKYQNDHALIIHAIDKLSYIDVKDTKIDVPYGMKGTYADAADYLLTALKDLDAPSMLDLAYSSFEHIRSAALNKQDISKEVAKLSDTIAIKNKVITDVASKSAKIFTTSNNGEVKFGNVFANMDQLKTVRDTVVQAEGYYSSIDGMCDKAKNFSALVTDVTALSDTQISKEQSDSLADAAMTIAKLLDLYSTCIQNVMTVSHNLTIVHNTLYTLIK